jgi:hypothetical protein
MEVNFVTMLLDLVSNPVDRTAVLPALTITPHPGGVRVSHSLEGARAEVERVGKGEKASDVLTLRLENVFGKGMTVVIGHDWVQVDDRLFEYKKDMPHRPGMLAG